MRFQFRLNLNVAARLKLAFTVLGLAIVFIVVLGALSLERISRGITQVVDGAAPAQKTVADLQIGLEEISRLALEHYNSDEIDGLRQFEEGFQDSVAFFERNATLLDQQLGNLDGLESSQDRLIGIVESSNALFGQVDDNMMGYARSLQTKADIEHIRAELQAIKIESKNVFEVLITGTYNSNTKIMVIESNNVLYEAFAVANELALVDSIEQFQALRDRFRELMAQFDDLGARMATSVDSEGFIGRYHERLNTLVGDMKEIVNADNGLFLTQSSFLQAKDSLRAGVMQAQSGLAEQVRYLNTIAGQVNQAAADIGQTAQNVVVQSRRFLIGVATIALVCSLVLSFLVVRSIRRPLKCLREYMTQVGEGDFTVKFGCHTQDELGEISRAAEQLVETLRQMISRVLEQNQRLSQVTLTTAEISDETRHQVERQRSELDQVVTAINEMTSSIREVASNAEVTSKEMVESEQDARMIEDTVGTTMSAVQTLEINMTQAVAVITQLDQGVAGIEDILVTIQDIAEQTNLLALNAAIEAARAGEQGRGFAVVADEVRTLAGRTQQSTGEIREKIEWMLQQSLQAVEVIEASQRSTRDVSEQTHGVQERFSKLMGAISRLNELNMMIATASEQQNATTEEINRNIVAIQEVAENTADGAQKASFQTHQLQKVAQDLDHAISQFRV